MASSAEQVVLPQDLEEAQAHLETGETGAAEPDVGNVGQEEVTPVAPTKGKGKAAAGPGTGKGARAGQWTDAEDQSLLMQAIKQMVEAGAKFSFKDIDLPGRTEKAIALRWDSIKKCNNIFVSRTPGKKASDEASASATVEKKTPAPKKTPAAKKTPAPKKTPAAKKGGKKAAAVGEDNADEAGVADDAHTGREEAPGPESATADRESAEVNGEEAAPAVRAKRVVAMKTPNTSGYATASDDDAPPEKKALTAVKTTTAKPRKSRAKKVITSSEAAGEDIAEGGEGAVAPAAPKKQRGAPRKATTAEAGPSDVAQDGAEGSEEAAAAAAPVTAKKSRAPRKTKDGAATATTEDAAEGDDEAVAPPAPKKKSRGAPRKKKEVAPAPAATATIEPGPLDGEPMVEDGSDQEEAAPKPTATLTPAKTPLKSKAKAAVATVNTDANPATAAKKTRAPNGTSARYLKRKAAEALAEAASSSVAAAENAPVGMDALAEGLVFKRQRTEYGSGSSAFNEEENNIQVSVGEENLNVTQVVVGETPVADIVLA